MAIPHELIIQVIAYGIVILLVLFVLSFLMRGLFWKFLKVKSSMGRLILVKIRSINIDQFVIGKIKEDSLVYELNKEEKKIVINDKSVFYRCLGVTWVDIDESKNALVKPDFTSITGFDAVLYNNLYLRALYKPAITNNMEKVMILLLIIITIVSVICVIMVMRESSSIAILKSQIIGISEQIKGQIIQSAVI